MCEFHNDDETRLLHYNDLKYASLTLFNAIVDALRKGTFDGLSFVDEVLKASKVIEPTTLMRDQMNGDESMYKRELIHWHLEDDGKMMYRIPNKVNSFKAFRSKKSCKVKDFSVEIVTKMYRLYMVNMQEIAVERALS